MKTGIKSQIVIVSNNGAWLFTHPDLVAKFNGEPLPKGFREPAQVPWKEDL